MENATKDKPKYSGYGYHGGGRKPTGRVKQFANATVSGSPEEIAALKELALQSGKSFSRFVIESLLK